ncbi:DUF1616 domain-containing protein [Salinirubellus salinus]|uniref:DUF1616 domain-containing protein n=1 Tax=Salinirubellus salinus TaxID=1364945 RepID=A0A9E7U833_9EURY|nr:DUF1616 domain-containing protein [Salinirubellus salinus]UWM54256.1 DUF1616 domain-containing protein [Salinirubellus salinus]
MTRTTNTAVDATLSQRLPVDLVAVVALALLTLALGGGAPSPLRVVLGALFVFVLPGYALVAALFPERSLEDHTEGAVDGLYNIEPGARLVLTVGLSLFVTPLAGILHSFSPAGIQVGTVLPTLAAFTVLAAAVAAYRRLQRPAARRFGLRVGTWLGTLWTWLRTDGRASDDPTAVDGTDRFDIALNVALVAGLVVATVGLAAAVGVPTNGERFTGFGLLTQSPDGDLVARDYPETLVAEESETLYVEIANHEERAAEYTVVVELQRLDDDGRVVESAELDRFQRSLAAGEDWQGPHDVTPTGALTGEDLRLTYLLYVGDAPPSPSTETAHRAAHIWVDVDGDDGVAT